MPNITAERVAENVRDALATAGLSERALGRSLSLSGSAIRRRLSGEVEFRPSELVQVARLLNTSARDLIDPGEAAA